MKPRGGRRRAQTPQLPLRLGKYSCNGGCRDAAHCRIGRLLALCSLSRPEGNWDRRPAAGVADCNENNIGFSRLPGSFTTHSDAVQHGAHTFPTSVAGRQAYSVPFLGDHGKSSARCPRRLSMGPPEASLRQLAIGLRSPPIPSVSGEAPRDVPLRHLKTPSRRRSPCKLRLRALARRPHACWLEGPRLFPYTLLPEFGLFS